VPSVNLAAYIAGKWYHDGTDFILRRCFLAIARLWTCGERFLRLQYQPFAAQSEGRDLRVVASYSVSPSY